jgi:hypothetical protein
MPKDGHGRFDMSAQQSTHLTRGCVPKWGGYLRCLNGRSVSRVDNILARITRHIEDLDISLVLMKLPYTFVFMKLCELTYLTYAKSESRMSSFYCFACYHNLTMFM